MTLYHPHSPVGKTLAHLHKAFVEELRLVYTYNLHSFRDFVQDFEGAGYGYGLDLMQIVRNDLDIGVSLVYGRLEDGYSEVGILGATYPAYQFLGLAGEH